MSANLISWLSLVCAEMWKCDYFFTNFFHLFSVRMLNSAQTSRISLVSVETDRGTVDSGVSMSMPGASFSLPSRDRVEKMPLLTQRHSAVRRRQAPPPPPPYPGPHTTISTCSSSCRCSSASHASSDSYLSSRHVSAPASLPSSSRSSMNGSGSATVQVSVPTANINSFVVRNTPSAPPPSLPSQAVSPGLPPRLTLRPSALHDFQRHNAGSFMTSEYKCGEFLLLGAFKSSILSYCWIIASNKFKLFDGYHSFIVSFVFFSESWDKRC